MVCVNVKMKYSGSPLKRTAVELWLDENDQHVGPVATDRTGKACFEQLSGSGKVFVEGVERYHGQLNGLIDIELRNLTETGNSSEGAASVSTSGSTAYPGMTTRKVYVDKREVLTDSEGYLVDPADWSENFVREQAEVENLKLTKEHWEVIRFQRDWYDVHGTQASVRDMVKHFRSLWDNTRGSSHALHQLFPRGGPQKQGNRLAGLLRAKGEF